MNYLQAADMEADIGDVSVWPPTEMADERMVGS
jgi:hypothetical protein